MASYTPSFRAQLITRRTYNRPLNDEGTVFETWEQTVDRVIRHQRWLWERAQERPLHMEQEMELEALRDLMLERKGMVSGRTLWLGGTEVAKRRESSQFNCSFLSVETVYDMVDMFWLLLQGCGVGFAPVRGTLTGFMRYIPEVEIIRSKRKEKGGNQENIESFIDSVWQITIGDSAESWAKAFGKLLAGKYPAKKLVIDLSEIRPAGSRLKGYGWICSGDAQLAVAFGKIAKILNKRAGRHLSLIDILDVGNLIGTVLSSRRSAEIALCDYGDPEWREFAMAKKDCWKNGNEHRQQSNNSLVFRSKPTKEQLAEIFQMMQDAGGSEPGFINAEAALKRAPWFKGTNPSLRAGTKVLTNEGIFPIEQLEGKKSLLVPNLHGKMSSAECFLSGKNKTLYRIELQGGYEYYATAEHKWPVYDRYEAAHRQIKNTISKKATVELLPDDIVPFTRTNVLFEGAGGSRDDGFLVGWILGDGWVTARKDGTQQVGFAVGGDDESVKSDLLRILGDLGSVATFHPSSNGAKSVELNTVNRAINDLLERCGWNGKERLPSLVWTGSEEFRKGLIDGLFSSDGHFSKEESRISISGKNKSLIKDIQELMGFYGIPMTCEDSTKFVTFPNGSSGTYEHWVARSIGGCTTREHFVNTFALTNSRKSADAAAFVSGPAKRPFLKVVSVTETEMREDVWDLTVHDDTHCFRLAGVVTGNCGEILLGNKSFCNLVEVDTAKFSDDYELGEAIKIMARANYRQTCTNLKDGILQESWHLNNKFLRLCGVGLTGLVKSNLDDRQLRELQYIATAAAYSMADELGMERPKNTSTVKPSGSLSKVCDTTEGVHRPIGRYVFNNVAFSIHDPIVAMARKAKYRVFDKPGDPSSVLITLPVDFGKAGFTLDANGKEVNVESAISQLERYKFYQTNWTQHNTSITVYYDPSEVPAIIDWLMTNWDHYVGVSFLYRADPSKTAEDLGYPYLPQEVVTEQAYFDYILQLRPINLDAANTFEELQDERCSTGACPIR